MRKAISYAVALSLLLTTSVLQVPIVTAATVSHGAATGRQTNANGSQAYIDSRQSGPGKRSSGKPKEVASMRSRSVKTFAIDGRYITDIYPNSINYRDSKGKWQLIDNTLVPTHANGFAFSNKANGYRAFLPSSLSSPVRFQLPQGTIDFALVGGAGTLKTKGADATYTEDRKSVV